MIRRTIFLVALLLAAIFSPMVAPPATAQQAESDQRMFSQLATEWLTQLDRLTLAVARAEMTSAEARLYREELAKLRSAAVAQRAASEAQTQSTRALLDALGPAPAADAPPEAPAVAAQRKELTEQIGTFEGRARQAELVIRRCDNILAQLSSAERTAFAERLMQSGPIPILPPVLIGAGIELGDTVMLGLRRAAQQVEIFNSRGFWPQFGIVLVIVLFAVIVERGPVRRWIRRNFGRQPEIAEPTYARRMMAATAEGVAIGLLPAIVLLGAVWLGVSRGLIEGRAVAVVSGAVAALAFSLIAAAVVSAALAPDAPAWRMLPINDAQARALSRRLKLLVAFFACDIAVDLMASTLGVPESLGAVYGLVSNSAIALMLFSVTQPGLWHRVGLGPGEGAPAQVEGEPDEPTPLSASALRWLRFRLVASCLMLAVPILALLGYGAMANYLVNALVWSGLLIVAYLALRAFAQEIATVTLDAGTRPGNWARRSLLLDDNQAERLRAWMQILVDAGLSITGILILLPIWGVSLDDIVTWMRRIMGGVSIGRYTLAPGEALAGLLVFAALYVATRLAQRFLSERVLPQTRLDRGAQDSIRASVGYLGITVAILLGVSAMGIDLSNIALIAGALSVGIGFGLQNIVNNFVSGLIMLAERPVRIGDVIRVGDQTGSVRAINVRATEVETGQGATVIVPNSVIVSAPVINLTHKNGTTRVDINLGVSYDSDPAKVIEVLMQCARANRMVLTLPQPMVEFTNFGPSALEFALRFYVAELAQIAPTSNELRIAILRAFRDQGIEFAYNRLDLQLLNPPGALAESLKTDYTRPA